MKNLFLFLIIATLSTGLVSCDSDNEISCAVREQQLTVAVLNLLQPSADYDADPSQENCEALRDAIQAALNEADDYRSCVPQDELADFEADYDEFTDALNNLPC